MIKALVFDLGGVLIDLDIKSCIKACKDEIGFDKAAEFLDPCHQKGIFMRLEEGTVSKEEFAAEVLKMCRPGTTEDDVAHAFRRLLVGVAPYKVDLLKELAARYDLYLLSNNNEISMPESKRIFESLGIPMDRIFKKLFLSYEMKMLKPGDAIFQTAIAEISRISGGSRHTDSMSDDSSIADTHSGTSIGMTSSGNAATRAENTSASDSTGILPCEMLFIDDSPANVEAARRNGMAAVCCPQGADLRQIIETAIADDER